MKVVEVTKEWLPWQRVFETRCSIYCWWLPVHLGKLIMCGIWH